MNKVKQPLTRFYRFFFEVDGGLLVALPNLVAPKALREDQCNTPPRNKLDSAT